MKVTHTCTSMYMIDVHDDRLQRLMNHCSHWLWYVGCRFWRQTLYITTDKLCLHCANDNFSISFISLISMVKPNFYCEITKTLDCCRQYSCKYWYNKTLHLSNLHPNPMFSLLVRLTRTKHTWDIKACHQDSLVCESAFLGRMIRGLMFLLCMSIVNFNLLTARELYFSFTTIAIAWSTFK